jgi:hypothetical protein
LLAVVCVAFPLTAVCGVDLVLACRCDVFDVVVSLVCGVFVLACCYDEFDVVVFLTLLGVGTPCTLFVH